MFNNISPLSFNISEEETQLFLEGHRILFPDSPPDSASFEEYPKELDFPNNSDNEMEGLDSMYLSQEQVTNILEMHPITISKAIKTEKLPAEQKNVKWQICSKDLFDYAREWDRNQSRVLRVENMLKENQKLFFTKHDTTKILKISPLTLSKMFFHAEKIQEKWKQKQFSRDELLEIAVELDRRYLKVPKVLRALRRLKEQFSEKPKVLTLTEAGILVEKDRNVIKYAIEKKKILPASKSKEGKYQISFEDLKEYALRHLHKQI